MIQFLLGFYVCGFIQTGALIYVGTARSEPKWSKGRRLLVSIVMAIFWPAVGPWMLGRVGGQASDDG